MSETVEWIDPDGTTTTLEVEWAAQGRFAPPSVFDEDGVPGQSGAVLRAVRHKVRDFVLPLWITAATESALRTAKRDLIASMDPIRGDGRIRVSTPVGDQREITCRVAAGLEMVERLGESSGPTLQRAPVLFRAHDPYWYALSDEVDTFELGSSGTASWFPIFPLRLASSEVFADATIINTGDVDVWPVWTITGPGDTIVLRNFTTGALTTLPVALAAGETATIDTRERFKLVTHSNGNNLFPLLGDSSLWPLQRGSNVIRVEMASATSASSVRLARKPRYLTA